MHGAFALLLGHGLNLALLVVAAPGLGPTQLGSLFLLVVEARRLVVDKRQELRVEEKRKTYKRTVRCRKKRQHWV